MNVRIFKKRKIIYKIFVKNIHNYFTWSVIKHVSIKFICCDKFIRIWVIFIKFFIRFIFFWNSSILLTCITMGKHRNIMQRIIMRNILINKHQFIEIWIIFLLGSQAFSRYNNVTVINFIICFIFNH